MGVADQLVELADEVKAAVVGHRIYQDHSISPLDRTGHVVIAAKAIGINLRERHTQVDGWDIRLLDESQLQLSGITQ